MPAQNTVVHTQANEAPDERAYDALAVHGGYTVGERVIWTNPYGIDTHPGEVVGLRRNGNLHIRTECDTTVDVHHSHVAHSTGQEGRP